MAENPRWSSEKPTPESWKAPHGRSASEAALEQDHAAGGREYRRVALPAGGVATASVELKLVRKGRRVYGYLRYSVGGRTVNQYLAEAVGETREERLACAWRIARRKGLTVARRRRTERSA